MQSVSPVFTDAEVQFEREIAKNRPEYLSVIGLPVTLNVIDRDNPELKKEIPDWAVSIRFRLSPEERAQVAAGLDLVVTQLTFGKPLHPMNFQLCPAKTKPIFELATQPPAALAQADGDASAADLDKATGEKTCEVIEFPDSARKQCVCGHQEHSGLCGKPRYSSDDLCKCEEFIDASIAHPE